MLRSSISAAMVLLTACAVRSVTYEDRKLTGTCGGVCDRYMACRTATSAPPGRAGQAMSPLDLKNRCESECPQILSDVELRQMYESLECSAAVEFVDGSGAQVAR